MSKQHYLLPYSLPTYRFPPAIQFNRVTCEFNTLFVYLKYKFNTHYGEKKKDNRNSSILEGQ